MPRNLDMTTLRSFVAVAEVGGVTRAAGILNLTQSAVSMQLKRLEESLDQTLLDRSSRQITLTAEGEQLLGYGRRILALNDEIYTRLTDQSFEGEITLGVPADIVFPHIPGVLKRFAAEYPRVKVQLISSFTNDLKRLFARGECDLILTTEEASGEGAEMLATLPLVWVGARDGIAWKQRPIRLALETSCRFRTGVQGLLDQAGIEWEMAVSSDSTRTIEASVTADLAVCVNVRGSILGHLTEIECGDHLPELAKMRINLYVGDQEQTLLTEELSGMLRQVYGRTNTIRSVSAA